MLVILAGAGFCAAADSTWMLITGQLLIGAGIGSDFATGATFIVEILPAKNRSRLMVGTIALQSVGLILGGAIALFLMHVFPLKESWKLFFEAEILLAFLLFILRLFLIESPRWLMSKGKNRKAGMALSKLFPAKIKEIEQMCKRAGDKIHHVSLQKKHNQKTDIRVLFSKEYLKRTFLVSLPWFLMDIATYGIGMFTPVILADMHFSGTLGNPLAIETGNITGAIVVDIFLLMGFIIALWLVPKFGRIRMQLIGFAGMFGGMLILILSTLLHVSHWQDLIFIFSGFILFNVLMNTGPNATTFALAPELFPTQLRASASGFAAGFAKIGAALGVFFVPIIRNKLGLTEVLELMALISFLGFLATLVFSERIEENKTLEQRHQLDK
jgi:MFS family permease